MQFLKQSHALSGIRGDIGEAHILPGVGPLADVSHVVLETHLATRQKQQPPRQARAHPAIGLPTPFSGAVGQHIGHTPGFAGIEFTQFIQTEEIIVVGQGHTF
jgi:hypothetical protein